MQLRGTLALFAVFGIALVLRLHDLDRFRLTGDAMHPYWEALRWLHRERMPWDLTGTGSSVRFGYGSWLLVTPLVAFADSLRELLVANAVLHTTGVLGVGLAGRRQGGWGAGLVAAGLYAVSPLLIDFPRQGAWAYQAPVAVAWAAWAGAAGRAHLLGVALAFAVMLHPYALAVVAGAAVIWEVSRRALPTGLLVLAPMILDNGWNLWLRWRMGEGGPGEVRTVGAEDALAALGDAWWQGLAPIQGDAAAVASAGLALTLLCFWRHGRFAAWTFASVVALGLLSWVLGYVQPYHLGVVLPLVFVAVGLGVASLPGLLRWPAYGVLVAAMAWAARADQADPLRGPLSAAALGPVEQVSRAIQDDAGDERRLVAGIVERQAGEVCTKALYLDQLLAGVPDEAFPTRRNARAYVLAGFSDEGWPERPEPLTSWEEGARYELLAFDDLEAGGAWWAAQCVTEGLYREPSDEGAGGVAAGRDALQGSVAGWSRCPE